MKRLLVLSAVLIMATVVSASAGTSWTEDFESGLGNWTTLNGTPTTTAAPVPLGLSFENTSGSTTRIIRAVDSSGWTTAELSFKFYTNTTATNTSRSFGGFVSSMAAPANGGLVRIGNNNQPRYQLHYFTTALQTVDTGVALAVGWHDVYIKVDGSAKTIDWKLDTTTGTQISNPNLLMPGAVALGYNFSNGVAGTDTTIWYDNVNVAPEPGSLLALGAGLTGLVGLVLRRKA